MSEKTDFFSMDRLIEFGMGMAMSQQIAQSMNNMMASMRVPSQVQVASQPLYAQNAVQQGAPMQPVYQQYPGTQNQQRQSCPVAPQQVSQNSTAFAQAENQNSENASYSPPPVPKQELLPEQKFPEVFYISSDEGKVFGPFLKTEAARFIVEKKLTAAAPVWKAGDQNWKNAADFQEIVALIALFPPKLSGKNENDEKISKGDEQK